MMRNEQGALHVEVLSSIPGRLRVQLQIAVASEAPFTKIPGVIRSRYNARIQTLLLHYDPAVLDSQKLLVQVGAVYAGLCRTKLLHIKHSEEAGFAMAPSGMLALSSIALDGILTLTTSPLTTYSRWLSVGTTLAAVVEHGYKELHLQGSFDPEVMSVVYLLNSIGKDNGFQASFLAWAMTFGRHLIPRAPREQVFLVRRNDRQITLTPLHEQESSVAFAGTMLEKGMEMMTRRPITGLR